MVSSWLRPPESATVAVRRQADAIAAPAENRVVGLAAQGFTNAEIAEQLLVGVSTVKTHLVHVYQKLGIDSRPALVAAAAGRPGADLRR